MDPYEKMIKICEQILELHEKQVNEKYSLFYSKRLRMLLNEAKKTATAAKRRLIEMDNEYKK